MASQGPVRCLILSVIPPGFVHDLLSRIDIVEVVGRSVDLKRAGTVSKGLCPFHGEKSPSFTVSASRQTYHCFGCGVHGNAIGFLMEQHGICLLYTSPSPRDGLLSRMPSSA